MNTKSAPFENVPDNKFYRIIAIVVAIAVVAIALVVVVPKVMSGGKTASSAVGEAVDNVKDNATGPIADAMRNDPAYDGSPVTAIDNPDKDFLKTKSIDLNEVPAVSVAYRDMNWYFKKSDNNLMFVVYEADIQGKMYKNIDFATTYAGYPNPITAWKSQNGK
jgi:hypothetical protein